MPPYISDNAPLLGCDGRQKEFSVTQEQLCKLVDLKLASFLADLGGTLGICQALEVDPNLGLSPNESFDPNYGIASRNTESFVERKSLFGRNELPDAPVKSIWSLIWTAYNDQTLIMLTVASIISLIVGIWEDNSNNHPADEPKIGWVDGVAIMGAVAVVVITSKEPGASVFVSVFNLPSSLVDAINDYEKEKQFRKLNAKKEDRPAKVLRRGIAQQIRAQDLVVGDIMFIEPGDILTADCLFIEGHNLRCDESTTTGESRPVKKSTDARGDCVILSGSKVLHGVAKVLVVAVGINSFYGRAMTVMRSSSEEPTPLQLKLNHLADQIAKFGFIAAGLMLGVLLLKLVVVSIVRHQWLSAGEFLNQLVGMVIQAITVIVVAVPEGLPMAVTLALAFATTEMLKDNNLVRHLSACETMGNATAVCSDKTGTLTENKMTVVRATMADKEFSKLSEMQRWKYQVNQVALDLLVEGISVNSTAFEGQDADGNTDFVGSTTECTLLEFTRKLGHTYQHVRSASKVVGVYPFNSTAKSMTTIIHTNDGNACSPGQSEYRVHTKGAAEAIVSICTDYIDFEGKVKHMDEDKRCQYETIIKEYAEKSLRTLAIAYSDVDAETHRNFDLDDAPLHNMVLLAIIGIRDQLRPGVVESVQAFRRAGIFVRMITGDNLDTSKAIAKECGILTAGGVAMTGSEFRALSVSDQFKVIPRLQVLARSSPVDKTIVVSRLQELNEVVAMTGDGTNDGPALKLANVGFAMGIAGTEVAKEASDIILMDDNFNSILQALKWGRAVNDGVRKFLTFQLTVNIAAVVVSFVSAVASETSESILSAVQLLWVNMIMDTFAALALATEPLTDDLVNRRPLRKDSSLINWRMSRMIIGQAIFQIAVNLLLMFRGPVIFGLGHGEADTKILQTMIFNVFVFMQVFNELNCRRIDDNLNIMRGITRDSLFLIIQGLVVVSQVLIIQYGGLAFKTVPLTPLQWACTIGIGSLSIPAGIIIRLLPNHLPYFWSENTNDEFQHVVSYSRLRWESAVAHILRESKLLTDHPEAVARKLLTESSPEGLDGFLGQQQPRTRGHRAPKV
ncbi:hypothetical protein DFQ28_006601 [Apophysomyces sp. BC1034]|nr:hypothetical protein DFQ30_003385 [Apophysomyces sp. BC1015]KAG0183013.1 hypothetical protein DFQ29_000824 [Apophysomyces sp. BC1021]KAG0194752.1 hypothetical protein DFQ28_006601 [Apophysomyces sp. BC1034]